MRRSTISCGVVAVLVFASAAQAQYVQRFNTISNGAVTFTGNTLGLDAETNQNGQGTRGAIGTFATTNLALRDITPAPTTAPLFPFGTTSDWRQNGSEAVLRLPAGARILHAELVWGGTFAGTVAADNVSAFINNPIAFTTPSGTFDVAPDPATAKSAGTVAGTGTCNGCFYVRSANVTALVAAGGAGTYTAGRVPATQGTTDNNNPAAGWTLAVVYEDFVQPIRNLSLFLGLEQSGGAAAAVSGFCTPPSGPVSGRLAVNAMEGDARINGDKMLFGRTAPLGDADRVQGARNPLNNFFAGQIVGDDGFLDTAGTFGDRNHTPDAPVTGGRQGWDITNVNVSAQLRNNQTQAFAQGTTTGDGYRIMALALQIDVGAPRFRSGDAKSVDRATALIGDVLTYTVAIDNSAGTTNANNLVFFDTPPSGTSFVPESFTVNGVARPGANPVAGVPLGTSAAGTTITVSFQARVDSIPAGPDPHLRGNRARWTFDFVSCAGQPAQAGANETNTVVTEVPVADLRIAKSFLNPPAIAGAEVTYQIVVANDGPSTVPNAVVNDAGTSPALTGVSWACTPVPGSSTCNPASGTGPLSSSVFLAGGGAAIFTVTGTLAANAPPGTVVNTATITAPAAVPDFNPANNTAMASAPLATSADLGVTKSGPATAQRGNNVTYTIIVTNAGPSDAQNVVVTDPTPTGLTLVTGLAGPCATAPGCSIPVGGSQSLSITFGIPPAYAGPDPIANVATVAAGTPDPETTNNSGRATTALNAPVADLAITKTDGVTEVAAGASTTYTITVTNAGPASAASSRVIDQFDPATFASVQWQCAASGTSTCTALGAQTGNIDTLISVDPGAGNAVTFTVQAVVRSDATGTAVNTATVATAAGVSDPSSADNSSTDTNTITTAFDVAATKTGPTTVAAGTTVEYTIVVSNNGPSVAADILVADILFAPGGVAEFPEFLAGVVAPPGIECPERPVTGDVTGREFTTPICLIPSLAPLASLSFTWRFTIPPDFPGSPDSSTPALENVVNAFVSPAVDSDLSNNFAVVPIVVPAQADVAITKIGPPAVVAGSVVSYFIRVSNNGPSTATNVVVEDAIPAGLLLVGGEGPCVAGFPCTIATLAPGDGQTTRIDLLVPVDYAGPRTFVNTASVSSEVPDPLPVNNSASVSTLVTPEQADLAVTITGPTVVAPGGVIEYVARVTNLGPGAARNVTSSVVLPGGTTLVGGSVPPPPTTCTVPSPDSGNLGSCLAPELPVGGFLDFVIRVQASPDLVPGSSITLVGTASSPTPDFNPPNDRAELTTLVAASNEAELSVEKTDSPDPVVAGGNVSYTIVVRNAGAATATGVTLTDTLPAEFTFVSATASQGSCVQTACSLGTLAPSAAATVTLVATTSTTGVFTNTATVTAAEPDPVPANNSVSQPTTVATPDQAELLIAKTGPAVLQPGDSSFYSILIVNRGPAPALNVRVLDQLPAGVTFAGNSGACVTAFPCDLGGLQPGQAVIVETAFTVADDLPTPATLVNTATVESLTPDPNLGNNSSATSAQLFANPSADLAVLKRDSPDPVVAGTTFSYTVTVANRGPSSATDVTLTDVLPTGVTLISAASTLGTCAGTSTLTCQLGTMPAGSIVSIGIVATAPLDVPTPNPMVNSVSVTSSGPVDPDPANNSATELTTVNGPIADLGIAKILTTPAIPGLAAGYTIVVTNNGPSAVLGAGVTDAFPAALAGVSWICTADAGSACSAASGTGNIATTIDLASGGTATFVVTATIASAALGVLSNTATIVAPTGVTDPNPVNNSATSSVTLAPSADLQISKSGPAQAVAGGNLTYAIIVTNAGPSDAVVVTLSDPTPAGLTFVSGGGPCASYPCALGTVPAGGTIVANPAVTFAVPPGYSTPDPIVNTATVSSATTPDPATGNNAATAMSSIAAPVTDLGITKTNGTTTAVPGATTTYTITVTNAGPSNAIGATVTDTFPAALTDVTWTCAGAGGSACSVAAGSGDINTTVTVPVGATVTFLASGTVALDAEGVLVNTATVLPGPGASDPSSANNTDADSLTPQVDLVITKTGPAAIVPGEPLVYTITVANSGPSNAANVVVSDPTPTGVGFVSNAGDCTTSFPCVLGTLPAGTTRTITATFAVPTGALVPDRVVNTAQVTTTTTDVDPSNNTATFETTVNRDADVELTKSVLPSTVRVGDTVVVTVNALNRGPNPASGVEVTDNLPAGLQFVSTTTTQGSYDQATGLWTVDTLAVNATGRLDITATVTSPGSITNLAVKTGQNEPDSNTANDSAAGTTNAVASADVSVQKDVDTSDPLFGTSVTFTVRATNRGPSGATGVTIADTLPAGLTFVSAAASQGSYDSGTGVWAVGSLDTGIEATLALVASVDQAGALSNNAAVASQNQVDPNPLNNSDAASVNAAANADLRVAKAVSNLAPGVGAPITYTVAVTNLGPSEATSAEILDALPASVAFETATTSQGVYDAGTGVWTLGTIPVNGTETLSITARVIALGAVDNAATRQSSAPVDPNPVNDSASVTSTPSLIADIAVTKTPSSLAAVAGTSLSWTIVVTNSGPSDVAGASVSDGFAATFTGVLWTCTASSGSTCGAVSGSGSIATTVDLLAGGNATFVATGLIAPAATGSIDNTANASAPAGTADPDLANNTATGSVQLTGSADLQLTGIGPPAVVPGNDVAYTFTITNTGPSAATGVTLNAPTPAGLVLASVSGACAALPCMLGGVIAPGGSQPVIVTFTVPTTYAGPSPIVVTAVISSPTDLNPSNDSVTLSTPVTPTADLSITKAGSASTVLGGTVTYTIGISNAGPSSAVDVTVADSTPPGLEFVSNSGDCTMAFPCALGTLPAGATRTITATFRAARTIAPGPIVNRASVTSSSFDPVPANNEASATTEIRRARTGCDVDGDGLDDIVTGAGPGGGPHVVVRSLAGGAVTILASFYAYDEAFGGGVYVACGDVNGDGRPDVITGAGPGGGPHVRAFSFGAGGIVEIASFWAYEPGFTGGVRVAAGDVNGDGAADIITAAGPSGGPHVRAFSVSAGAPTEVASFFAYDPAFAGGVFVAAGDVTGDGLAEIITGTTREGGPVRVFRIGGPTDITELTSFFAYFAAFPGPVRVAAADVDGDGAADIVTGAGPGGGPHVLAFSLAGGGLAELASFYAYDPLLCDIPGVFHPLVCDGVFVAGGDVNGDGRAEIITGTNRSGGPVRVFTTGPEGISELASFFAYFPAFPGPVRVAAAHLDNQPGLAGSGQPMGIGLLRSLRLRHPPSADRVRRTLRRAQARANMAGRRPERQIRLAPRSDRRPRKARGSPRK